MNRFQSIVICGQSPKNPSSCGNWKRIDRLAIMGILGLAALMYQPTSQAYSSMTCQKMGEMWNRHDEFWRVDYHDMAAPRLPCLHYDIWVNIEMPRPDFLPYHSK